jgi:hypothetical protein
MKKLILLLIITSFLLTPMSGLKAQVVQTNEELLRSLLQQQIELLTKLVLHLQSQLEVLLAEKQKEKEIKSEDMEKQFEDYIIKRENRIKEETEIKRIKEELDNKEGLKYSIEDKEYKIWFEGMIYAGVINKDQSELEILREISGIVVKREEDIKKAKEEKEIETRKEECLKNSSNTWNNETKSCHYFWEDYIKQQNNIGA